MKTSRSLLLIVSVTLVLLLVGSGVAVRVGAEETSYRQAVMFAEILSLLIDNYVDPVETDRLLAGAYEGLLAGLDVNGAYLSPDDVQHWKQPPPSDAGPGVSVLKTGRMLQVVAVEPDSPAAEAGFKVGDQIRTVDGRYVRKLSLEQSRRLLLGKPGTAVTLGVLRTADEFRAEDVEVARAKPRGRAHDLDVRGEVAVLRLTSLQHLDIEELTEELDAARSRGVETLLVDLRNVADDPARAAVRVAPVFLDDTSGLVLRDRDGETLEVVDGPAGTQAWGGELALLVNGATAGGAEALTLLLQKGRQVTVYGETTFGLGAEPDLIELDNGSGLLLSVGLWETRAGDRWNSKGIEPDERVSGRGDSLAEAASDQLDRVLERLESAEAPKAKAA